MRLCARMLSLLASLVVATAYADGPQIQVTNDGNKIVTRQVFADEPYINTLSQPTLVYVMPLLDSGGVTYSRPNNTVNSVSGAAVYPSGPGFAYGYDLADGGPQLFESGSVFTLAFTDGLKVWSGAAFVDAGNTQLKAFRRSNVNISTPPADFAITSDVGPFDTLSLTQVLTSYGPEGAGVHTSLRFAMLGDGADPLSVTPNGVYLLGLQLSSSQSGLAPSDPYYFVLYKNASVESISSAINSLGVPASAIQWTLVPEPATFACSVIGMALLGCSRIGRRVQRASTSRKGIRLGGLWQVHSIDDTGTQN